MPGHSSSCSWPVARPCGRSFRRNGRTAFQNGRFESRGPRRAAGVAFADFAAEIAKEKAAFDTSGDLDGGTAPDGGPSPEELARTQAETECISHPGFYDSWVYLDDAGTRYVVEFWPKPEICYGKNVEFYGGGASYVIDARSFEILKKELGE